MQLTDYDIREFIDIWKREFDEELTAGQARHEASLLLELYWLLAQPLPTPTASGDDEGADNADPE